MFFSYIKSAYRNLVRYRAYGIINIAGLAVGIAACLLLFVIIHFELSFDTFHANASNIYRVVTRNEYSNGTNFEEGIASPATEALRNDFPQAKLVTELYSNYGCQINIADRQNPGLAAEKKFTEYSGACFTDPEYFGMFSSKWLAGTPAVLSQPNAVVIDKSHAEKYFGDWQQAMGGILKMDNILTLQVAGIIEDPAPNSDLPFHVLVSYITLKHNADAYGQESNWNANVSNHQVYMLLPDAVRPAGINQELIGFVKKHFGEGMNAKKTYFLQPLFDIHFDKRFEMWAIIQPAVLPYGHSPLWALSFC